MLTVAHPLDFDMQEFEECVLRHAGGDESKILDPRKPGDKRIKRTDPAERGAVTKAFQELYAKKDAEGNPTTVGTLQIAEYATTEYHRYIGTVKRRDAANCNLLKNSPAALARPTKKTVDAAQFLLYLVDLSQSLVAHCQLQASRRQRQKRLQVKRRRQKVAKELALRVASAVGPNTKPSDVTLVLGEFYFLV